MNSLKHFPNSASLSNQPFVNLIQVLQERATKDLFLTSKPNDNLKAYTFLENGERIKDSLNYRELEQQAKAIAIQLQSYVEFGERALLIYPSGLEFIKAFFGCLYAGIIAVPVNPPRKSQKMSRLQAIIKDAQPQLILTTGDLLGKIETELVLTETVNLHYIATDNLDLDKTNHNELPIITKETIALLQYTSGATGIPKGVIITHGNILHNAEYIKQAFKRDINSISVNWLPHFHDMGLIGGIIVPLYAGNRAILMSPEAFIQNPLRWLKAISDYRATHSGAPNFGYEICVNKIKSEAIENLDLSSWLLAYTGSETIRSETIKNFSEKFSPSGFQAKAFYPCYGMAEATLMISGVEALKGATFLSLDADAFTENKILEVSSDSKNIKELVSCGNSSLDSQIFIVDADTNLEKPLNEIGEIWISGLNIAQGYWQKLEETKLTFQAKLSNRENTCFLRTGDLGFIHNGELYITGRLKDLIIIRGRNYYPHDLEYTIQNSHSAFRLDCGAAFSIEVNNCENLVIVQEIERSYLRNSNFDEIINTIKKAIASEYDLEVYSIVLIKPASLAKTSSGKIQRSHCRNAFKEGSLNIVAQWQAKLELKELTPNPNLSENCEGIEEWLINRLAFYLKIEPETIDIEQPFAYYGLDSSVAITLTNELAQWLGCELEPTLFWEYSNIESLTHYLINQK